MDIRKFRRFTILLIVPLILIPPLLSSPSPMVSADEWTWKNEKDLLGHFSFTKGEYWEICEGYDVELNSSIGVYFTFNAKGIEGETGSACFTFENLSGLEDYWPSEPQLEQKVPSESTKTGFRWASNPPFFSLGIEVVQGETLEFRVLPYYTRASSSIDDEGRWVWKYEYPSQSGDVYYDYDYKAPYEPQSVELKAYFDVSVSEFTVYCDASASTGDFRGMDDTEICRWDIYKNGEQVWEARGMTFSRTLTPWGPGVYTVKLTVEDMYGNKDYFERKVKVGVLPPATISLDPIQGAFSTLITVWGMDFNPDENVLIRWGSKTGEKLGSATADSDGAFSVKVKVPENAEAGDYTICAVGTANTASAKFSVTSIKPELYVSGGKSFYKDAKTGAEVKSVFPRTVLNPKFEVYLKDPEILKLHEEKKTVEVVVEILKPIHARGD